MGRHTVELQYKRKLIYFNYIHKPPNYPGHRSILTKIDNGIVWSHNIQFFPNAETGKIVTRGNKQRTCGSQ